MKYKNYTIYSLGKNNYQCILINGVRILLHVFVWEEVNGEKPKGYDIHHIDGDRTNYNISNLELLSSKDHHRLHFGYKRENGIWIEKLCRKCKNSLPLEKFYYKKSVDNYSPYCIKCTSIYNTEMRIKHKENIKKQQLKWYLKNKDRVNEYHRRYYKELRLKYKSIDKILIN